MMPAYGATTSVDARRFLARNGKTRAHHWH